MDYFKHQDKVNVKLSSSFLTISLLGVFPDPGERMYWVIASFPHCVQCLLGNSLRVETFWKLLLADNIGLASMKLQEKEMALHEI